MPHTLHKKSITNLFSAAKNYIVVISGVVIIALTSFSIMLIQNDVIELKEEIQSDATKSQKESSSIIFKQAYSIIAEKKLRSEHIQETTIKHCSEFQDYILSPSNSGILTHASVYHDGRLLCEATKVHKNKQSEDIRISLGVGEQQLVFSGSFNAGIKELASLQSIEKKASLLGAILASIVAASLVITLLAIFYGNKRTRGRDHLTGFMQISEINDSSKAEKLHKTNSIAILDLDYFQHINNEYGHAVGDYVIHSIAKTIKKWAGKKHSLYRMNGEKFLIILDKENDLDDSDLIDNLLKLIKHTKIKLSEDDFFIQITATAGLCSDQSISFENRRALAEQAMNEQKKLKKGFLREKVWTDNKVFGDKQNVIFGVKEIINALNSGSVFFEYQPIFMNCGEAKKIIYEALIRIKHADKIIYPGMFLSKIKNTAIEEDFTKYTIDTHLALLDQYENVNFSINLDNKALLQEDVLERLHSYSNEYGRKNTSRLTLEILEDNDVVSYETLTEKINLLRSFGYKVAIDDFGSGYSNFTHILKMNVDYIKIDGEIIRAIMNDDASLAIAKSIKFLSDEIKVPVIAEFVASQEIFEKLDSIGICNVQGFYISKPRGLLELLDQKEFVTDEHKHCKM